MDHQRLTAWLRTVVPGLWSALIAWAVTAGAPTWLTDLATEQAAAVTAAVVAVVLAGWYALWRWAEPRLPEWVVRLVLGSARIPVYDRDVDVQIWPVIDAEQVGRDVVTAITEARAAMEASHPQVPGASRG